MKYVDTTQVQKSMTSRLQLNRIMRIIFLVATLFGLVVLLVLFYRVLSDGLGWINIKFLTNKLSTDPYRAGIMGAILGTLWLIMVVAPVTMFLGIGTAIYLEEYARKGRLQSFIQTNISNLAGVPSIVFGILGLTVFVRGMGLGNIILAGGLTMALLVLPIVVVASQESLPALLIPFPDNIFDKFTVLPMQIYYWTIDAALVAEYANLAAATIVILLLVLLIMNSIAVIIRNKFQKRY